MTTNDHSHHSRRSICFMGGLLVSGMSRGTQLFCPINEEMFLITGISLKGTEFRTDVGIKAA